MKTLSKSVGETIETGERLAKKLKRGSVVALIGGLGSGKTVLTKGIAKGLGVKNSRYVNSPTFVIIKEYRGKLPLYHFDLYRLNRSSELDIENFEEYFYGDGVTVIEWADKIREYLPSEHIEVRMKVAGEGARKIEIKRRMTSLRGATFASLSVNSGDEAIPKVASEAKQSKRLLRPYRGSQ